MAGILYGVGVGPGDPELMTLKAVRVIRENEVIALPGNMPEETAAYRIAVQAVPELAEKELVPVRMPMDSDRAEQERYHQAGAEQLEAFLRAGRSVVFLTLGDPAVYSTFSYIQRIVQKDGFEVCMVSGVTSFCAAAAALKIPLAEGEESIHIIPAAYRQDLEPDRSGNYVLMKAGSTLRGMKEILRQAGHTVRMAENCGMPEEKLYRSLEEIPDEAGYYSLIIAKEKGRDVRQGRNKR